MPPRIITREEWQAQPPRSRVNVPRAERTEFFTHYSTGQELGREDSAEWVRQIQAYHLRRGWDDIGYGHLVDHFGDVYVGRGFDYQGAHCPGHNRSGFSVCFLGNDDPHDTDATPEARASIRWLFDQAQAYAGHELVKLGHRDGKATACPGDELYAWVHAGMPVPGSNDAPPFPLPAGAYFGPHGWGDDSRSGYARASDRDQLRVWQRAVLARGLDLGPSGADGFYGKKKQTDPSASYTGRAAMVLQRLAGEREDGLIGPATWPLAFR